MARGRFLSETIARDKRLNGLSLESEYVFLKTIPHLDRDGRIHGDPDVLFGQVCPKRPRLQSRMELYIDEWAKAGLVERYMDGDNDVLFFCGFAKNQIGLRYDREGPSKFPPPPSATMAVDEVGSSDGVSPEELRSSDGVSPEELPLLSIKDQVLSIKDQEGEREGESVAAPPAPTEPPQKILRPKNGNAGNQLTFTSPYVDNSRFDLTTGYIGRGAGMTAIEVYYERFDVTKAAQRLTGPMEDDLVQGCADLNLLREVVIAYSQAGFKGERNIALILDWYQEPERFRTKALAPAGKAVKVGNVAAGLAAIDEYERMLAKGALQ